MCARFVCGLASSQISPRTARQDRSGGLMVVFGNGLAVEADEAKEERPEWSNVVRRARSDLVPRVDVMLRSCAGALVGDVGGVVECYPQVRGNGLPPRAPPEMVESIADVAYVSGMLCKIERPVPMERWDGRDVCVPGGSHSSTDCIAVRM